MSLFKSKSVNVLPMTGIIMGRGGRRSISFDTYRPLIDKAFKNAEAVALLINSPGGSPAQSEMIANYIKAKAEDTKIPLMSFVEDIAASGGYWLALAGDKIYACARSSIVGSLGVVYAGFGLDKFIKRYDIERRVYTAGTKKVSLDMFQKENPDDIVSLREKMDSIHDCFKDWVKERRDGRLRLHDDELFSGDIWLSETAVEHGLIDEVSCMYRKIRDLYGDKIKINYIRNKPGFFSRLSGQYGVNTIVDDGYYRIIEESWWSRCGL